MTRVSPCADLLTELSPNDSLSKTYEQNELSQCSGQQTEASTPIVDQNGCCQCCSPQCGQLHHSVWSKLLASESYACPELRLANSRPRLEFYSQMQSSGSEVEGQWPGLTSSPASEPTRAPGLSLTKVRPLNSLTQKASKAYLMREVWAIQRSPRGTLLALA